MTPLTEQQEKTWMIARIIAVAVGIVAPALYLAIASFIHPERSEFDPQSGGHVVIVFYILLFLAMFGPLLARVIERVMLPQWRQHRALDQVYLSRTVIRLALVEACFIYGFIVYLITSDLMRLLLFYPIGLIWLAIYWPRRDRFQQFVQNS